MTLSQIDQTVSSFIKARLSPKVQEQTMISQRYGELQEILEARTFQNGSYARHTSITPVNDLDVFYVLPPEILEAAAKASISPSELRVEDILESLATALRKHYPTPTRVVVQPHSIGIFFGSDDDFSIDVVPAQAIAGDLFLIPESGHLSVRNRRIRYKGFATTKTDIHWIKSDPKGYIEQAVTLDSKTIGRFRKTAKLVKKWRAQCKLANDAFPLKSFHVEQVVTDVFRQDHSLSCLAAATIALKRLKEEIGKPCYRDRADSNTFIDQYVQTLGSSELSLISTEVSSGLSRLGPITSASTDAEVIKGLEGFLRLDRAGDILSLPSSERRVSQAHSKPYSIG